MSILVLTSTSSTTKKACIDNNNTHSVYQQDISPLIWKQGTGAANTGSVLVILAQNGYTREANHIISLCHIASLIGRDSNGGLPELWDIMGRRKGTNGITRLMAVCISRGPDSPQRARALIRDHNVNVNETDNQGRTALHYALNAKQYDNLLSETIPINIELIHVLVNTSSSKELIVDKFGKIPLHYACQSNAPFEVIKCLVENFDGIKVKCKDGKLALNFSLLVNAPFEVIKYLLISHPNGVEQRLSLSFLSPSSLTALTCEKVLKENGYIILSIVAALRTIAKSLVGKQACLDAGAHLALTELINEKVVKEDGTIAGSIAGALWNIAMTDAGCESCIKVGVPRSLILLAKEKAIQESSFAAWSIAGAFINIAKSDSGRQACIEAEAPFVLTILASKKAVQENWYAATSILEAYKKITGQELVFVK
jgi:ankyrin repeat protein